MKDHVIFEGEIYTVITKSLAEIEMSEGEFSYKNALLLEKTEGVVQGGKELLVWAIEEICMPLTSNIDFQKSDWFRGMLNGYRNETNYNEGDNPV